MKNIGLLTLVLILFFSCGKKGNEKFLYSATSNLDANNFWINSNTISKGNAHSGLFSSKIDPTVEFGIGIGAKINDLTTTLPKKVNIHCWVYSNSPSLDASLVCELDINGHNLGWQEFKLKTSVPKANEWVEVTNSFNLPINITQDTDLKVYFWNPNKLTFYADDFDITLE